jgi:hypothetical protein
MSSHDRIGLMLLLADMHLGSGPLSQTEVPPLEPHLLGRVLRLTSFARDYFRKKCAAQDGNITQRLVPYVRSLLAEASRRGLTGSNVELCLLLGDQVTFPDPRAFDYLVSYVTQSTFSTETGFGQLTSDGLGIPHDRLLTIAGNHDKLLRRNLDDYHQGVSLPLGHAAEPREQSCRFVSRNVGGWEFLFILVDTNEYAQEDMQLEDSIFEYRRHLAAGRVSERLLQQVRDGLRALADGRAVGEAQLDDYRAATKVLVLHYAASRWAVSGFPGRDELALPHGCRDVNALFEAANGQIDLALHGHLHKAKVYRHAGVPVISVPTLCQLGQQERGFFVLEAHDAGVRRTLSAHYHRWHETSFLADPSHSLTLQCRTPAAAALAV